MRFILLIIAGFVLSANAAAQVGKSYWTRTILATQSDCKIRFSESELAPGEKDCEFAGFLNAGTRLKMTKLAMSRPWAKAKLQVENGESFEIEILNTSNKIFMRSVINFLSTEESGERFPTCKGKRKKDFITSVGFPSRITRNGKNESWQLGLEHPAVQSCGFDIATISFEGDKLVNVAGII